MIDGIEILNKEEIIQYPSWLLFILFITIVLFVIGMILILFYIVIQNDNIMVFGVTLIFSSLILSIILLLLMIFNNETKYQYQVLIDDSVQFKLINEHYNIIEHKGKIWTIMDK